MYIITKKKSNTVLSTGQQKRIDALENAVKNLRGIVEVDLSRINNEINKMNFKIDNIKSNNNPNQSAGINDISSVEQELSIFKDKIRLIDSRFNSTLDLIGKSEIRIMRLESFITSSSVSEKISNNNILSSNLEENKPQTKNNLSPNTVPSNETGDVEVSSNESGTLGLLSVENNNSDEVFQRILPDVTPEEQFKFSLELALKRKYDEAELALNEFMIINPAHERNQDAHYWYGGVLFKQKKYEDSAFSDIDFNDKYPDDPRTVDTTLRIAQAMSYVAPPEQACTVFENSLNFIVDPPERFVRKINELKADKACD
jgi:TolA-binding protein